MAKEIVVRGLLAITMASAALLSGCDKPGADKAGATPQDVNRFRAEVNANSPYAGQWAAAASSCDDDRKVWTIEPHRMGVQKIRFCAFKSLNLSQPEGSDDAVWSAAANCLSDGHESKDFVFFRVKPNLREMRVTFNDSRPIDLVRCLSSS
ncbi:MAG: hypothetical protein ABI740_01480 [Alphaproteobacteria bacterium]